MTGLAFPDQPGDLNAWVDRQVEMTEPNTSTGWLLWFLLGGFGAHLAWLYPRSRGLVLALSIVGFVITLGLSGFVLWLFSWPCLLGTHALDQRRQVARERIGQDVLLRRNLGGES
jgi:hypothetical protein